MEEVLVRVVIAPDSFKGTAPAAAVAEALAAGWREARPADDLVVAPMADGGEGSIDAFGTAMPGAVLHEVEVRGPLQDPVASAWLELPGRTAVVELALSSGLALLPEPRPAEAHTTGLGETIASALASGAQRVLVCIGGSSSTDGGAGLLAALGARLLDDRGAPIPPGAAGLDRLARVDLSGLAPVPALGASVLSDVDAPLIGPTGAVRRYGPQKGVPAVEFDRYEARLSRLAALLGVDPLIPGAGAAGGAGLGLLAWGATPTPGAAAVAAELRLDELIASADVVITGEGRFDEQSSAGKVPDFVARSARGHGVPALLVAGSVASPPTAFADHRALVDLARSVPGAMADPLRWLREAGRGLAAAVPA